MCGKCFTTICNLNLQVFQTILQSNIISVNIIKFIEKVNLDEIVHKWLMML